MKILHVVGARPNFMKVAPIMHEMSRYPEQFEQILVHTGQHYDKAMSQVFFDELELPVPDINLEVGSGSHAQQTALIMQKFEPVLLEYKPDWVFVPGDVNSTVACALVASKLGIKVAHVEAGLRSFDRTMPEEINRIVTDHLSDLLFTTEPSGNENLAKEGIPSEKVRFVGNTMIDTLLRLLPKAEIYWSKLQQALDLNRYTLVTLHRPSNVDDPTTLQALVGGLLQICEQSQVLFPVHPRTRDRLLRLGYQEETLKAQGLQLLSPLGYLDFVALQAHAALVVTDSGGVQEETTILQTPCLTARPNTERPVTITMGTNRLIESNAEAVVDAARQILSEAQVQSQEKRTPPLWDGKAAGRIVKALSEYKN